MMIIRRIRCVALTTPASPVIGSLSGSDAASRDASWGNALPPVSARSPPLGGMIFRESECTILSFLPSFIFTTGPPMILVTSHGPVQKDCIFGQTLFFLMG